MRILPARLQALLSACSLAVSAEIQAKPAERKSTDKKRKHFFVLLVDVPKIITSRFQVNSL